MEALQMIQEALAKDKERQEKALAHLREQDLTTLVWFSSPSLPPTKVRATPDDDYGEIFTCPACHTGYTAGPAYSACGYCGASVARVLDIIEGGQALSVQKFQKQVERIRR